MITAAMRRKAMSPASRRKAARTMKRTLAAKKAAKIASTDVVVSRVPIDAIPMPAPRKAATAAAGPSFKMIAKLIVHVARVLNQGE